MTDNPEGGTPRFVETEYSPPEVTPIRPRMKSAGPASVARAADLLKGLADPRHLSALPAPAAGALAEALSLLDQVTGEVRTARAPLKIRPYIGHDPTTIARREWVYPRTYVKKFVTVTVAPGGLGKTGLSITEALAMVTGRDLLNDGYDGEPRRVWFWNGEDPYDELVRQVEAAKLHYGITDEDIGGRLFLDSGRDLDIKLARVVKGECQLDRTIIAELTDEIRAREIDVAIFDPFVTIHAVPESSNDAIDQVATALAQIANDTGCAMGIVAHTRKLVPGGSTEVTADDNRGASALVNKARVARVLNRMSEEEAKKAGIQEGTHLRYFRVGGEGNKQNLTPPSEDKTWRYNASVSLPNGTLDQPGDSVRVCTPWQWVDAFNDITPQHLLDVCRLLHVAPQGEPGWRSDVQATNWVGKLIAQVIDIDPNTVGKNPTGERQAIDQAATSKVQTILKTWISNGAVVAVQRRDAQRKLRTYILPAGANTGVDGE